MKNNNSMGNILTKKVPCKHFLRIMRTTFILLFICAFSAMAENGHSQNARVTMNKRNSTLQEVLNEIEKQTDYLFIYNNEINASQKVSVRAKKEAVSSVLNSLLKERQMDYSMEGNHIILSVAENIADASAISMIQDIKQQKRTINGTVLDEGGIPIIGANVIEVGTTNGSITDMDGSFTLQKRGGVLRSCSTAAGQGARIDCYAEQ